MKTATDSKKRDKQPLISVIVPVYNTPLTIARCLDSVFKQTYKNLEIIVVDDGSTDISGEIAERLTMQDSRAKFMMQKNQGPAAARNAGMKQAQGEYFVFVDADDECDLKMIEKLYKAVEKNQTKMAVSVLREVKLNGKTYDHANRKKTELLSAEQMLCKMLCDDEVVIGVGGLLVYKELFSKVKWPKGKKYEDVATIYKLVMQCEKVAYVPQPLYFYYQTKNSTSRSKITKRNLHLVENTDKMCDDLEKKFSDEQLLNAIKLRRLHARFSILRMIAVMPMEWFVKTTTEEDEFSREELVATRKELTRFIKEHRQDITKNPLAKRRDKIALTTLCLGFPVFGTAWRIYLALRPY